MRLYKNWKGICQLNDTNFKLWVSLCNNWGLLNKLAAGFPELFTQDKPEYEGPFPLSVVRRVADSEDPNGDNPSNWDELLRDVLGLPWFTCAPVGSGKDFIPMPMEIIEKMENGEIPLIGHRRKPSFPETLERITIGGIEYYIGFNWWGTEVELQLYPCALIDENA